LSDSELVRTGWKEATRPQLIRRSKDEGHGMVDVKYDQLIVACPIVVDVAPNGT